MQKNNPISSNKNTQKTWGERKRFLTGVKPSGEVHIGNYFGAINPCIELSNNSNKK